MKSVTEMLEGNSWEGFVSIEAMFNALLSCHHQCHIAPLLDQIITDGSVPFLMLNKLQRPVPASPEAKAWADKYLEACFHDPLAMPDNPDNFAVGWKADEIIANETVRAILEEVGIVDTSAPTQCKDINLAKQALAGDETQKPKQQQVFQEEEILRVIKKLGHAATSLPKITPGKRGVKAAVREELKIPPSIFDKAWERLRKDDRIKESA